MITTPSDSALPLGWWRRNSFHRWCLVLLSLLAFTGTVNAITLSPEQLAQFRKLSESEQRELARQAGIELPKGALEAPRELDNPEVVVPREQRDRQRRDRALSEGEGHRDGQRLSQDREVGNDGSLESSEQAGRAGMSFDASAVRARELPFSSVMEKGSSGSLITDRLEPFGYDLFAGAPTTFAPATHIPVPSEYILGPGDTVVIQLYGKENTRHELLIDRDGMLRLLNLAPITVVGMSFDNLRQTVTEAVAEQMIGVRAHVSLGELRSMQVFVLGEAYQPGSYTVSALSTMTNALFVSGGVTEIGSLRNVQLKRKGEVVATLDLYDLLLHGDTKADRRLQPGDVLFIPPVGPTVGVSGEVRRPAIYELKRETTLQEIVTLAGGYLPTAYPQATRVARIDSSGQRTLVDVDLTAREGQRRKPRNGDRLHIHSVLQKMENSVFLAGHVHRPTGFAWRAGMRVSDVIRSQELLKPGADMDYAIIQRETPASRELQVLSFSVRQVLSEPGSVDDLILHNRDRIHLFNLLADDRTPLMELLVNQLQSQASLGDPTPWASVTGHVRFPGAYPLTEGMRVKELLQAAGGLSEQAFVLNAEVTRSIVGDNQEQTFSRIEISLNEAGRDIDNYLLMVQPRDQLHVKKIPFWGDQAQVEITGEVRFPGQYPIKHGDTLSDLVQRAGGFTELAAPQAAIFTRESLREREQRQLDQFRERLTQDLAALRLESAQDASNRLEAEALGSSLLDELTSMQATGRLVIDLPHLLNAKGSTALELKDGDHLVIPPVSREVSVLGEVQYPTSHFYRPGMKLMDYVNISGGFTAKSDEKRIYVIRANGEIEPAKRGWFSRGNLDIEPGDTVVIPYDVYAVSGLTYWGNVSQVLFNLSTTVAALKAVGLF